MDEASGTTAEKATSTDVFSGNHSNLETNQPMPKNSMGSFSRPDNKYTRGKSEKNPKPPPTPQFSFILPYKATSAQLPQRPIKTHIGLELPLDKIPVRPKPAKLESPSQSSEHDDLPGENKKLQAKITHLTTMMSTTEDDLALRNEELVGAKSELAAKDREIRSLKFEVLILKRRLNDTLPILKDLSRQCQDLVQDKSMEIKEHKLRIATLEKQLDDTTLMRDEVDLRGRVIDHFDHLQSEITDMKRSIDGGLIKVSQIYGPDGTAEAFKIETKESMDSRPALKSELGKTLDVNAREQKPITPSPQHNHRPPCIRDQRIPDHRPSVRERRQTTTTGKDPESAPRAPELDGGGGGEDCISVKGEGGRGALVDALPGFDRKLWEVYKCQNPNREGEFLHRVFLNRFSRLNPAPPPPLRRRGINGFRDADGKNGESIGAAAEPKPSEVSGRGLHPPSVAGGVDI
ncbi:hypothetical protein GGS23DRAFT_592659 [Durotheca rogersii]|uniref:uncharacterized protein n=1 Tax=Durotheca rogersii TaxID=419775 RepID=UPI00221EA911|nr:uncharacterized protein GGS23DRAFT_592659 [Durotheca rogersii]KAI5867338.1 hypothetical protein GGS23DRAFT_592659 [Durotheca rogersii]